MMLILDTNTLIRFFTKDDENQADKVYELLKSDQNCYIPDVVFPELEYVLEGVYQLQRSRIIKIFHFLISRKNIKLNPELKQAINYFENSQLDMADCIIAAYAKGHKLASFDKKLLKMLSQKSVF